MLSILFWNLRGNQKTTWPYRSEHLRRCIANLANGLNVDLFLFAESGFEAVELIEELNRGGQGTYHEPHSIGSRVQIYSRLSNDAMSSQYDSVDGRLTVRRILRPQTELLLAAVHGRSRMHYSELEQALDATDWRSNLERTENDVGHQRTVMMGDLNMNPFDPGVVTAGALNAVMTRELAARGEIRVAGQQHRQFYNPMWGLFGDRGSGPPGTLFYSSGTPLNYYWHIVDQVLLRPEIAEALREVRILGECGGESLLTTSGRPRSSDLSDHLPILCRLEV